ncbi:hypothetical protein ONZ43_g3561 [Nemania bipapillata]|uniref:Uncharacterized protein n=1 Tax=Nemania bipapillata TaxID=110536 RepID=A0ACC2IW98_9PEZI|nr:hypothetical protein ONZ43_g3561 [Nemania bipapillata]
MATNTAPVDPIYRQRFFETLHHVPKSMAKIMGSYSGIPEHEQIAHITKLRNEAYAQFPYPCMGTFRFLDLDLARHEAYKEHVRDVLLQPALSGKPEPLFLDCGCCLGQEVRKLAADGAPPHRLWASDIEPRFIELGFELFRDADKLPRDHFLCPGDLFADTTDPSEDQLNVLNDKVTILNVSAVFHLFDLDEHQRIVNRCLRLLRKDTGVPMLVLGGHVGGQEPSRVERGDNGKYRYLHNGETWEALWRGVCDQPQWKDTVAALKVKTKLFGRIRNEDPNADELVSLCEPYSTDEARLWQMFEVWVTFKSGA